MSYAEDDDYVDTIVSIIHDNKLTQYDNILSLLTVNHKVIKKTGDQTTANYYFYLLQYNLSEIFLY